MNEQIEQQAKVPETLAGKRLDQIAARVFPDFSRARLQIWIKEGKLKVNDHPGKAKDKLAAGDHLHIIASLEAEGDWVAEPLPLNIVYEDADLLVLNKPAGLVVHPASGHPTGTMLNGLLHHHPELKNVPRAGIVHRLDKDTTGLLVVAKTLSSHHALVEQLQQRQVSREYEAIVQGVLTGGGTVDAPIGRHPKNHKKQAVNERGKEAITHYRVITRFRRHTHIGIRLETGRTHQIRVHSAHIKHPITGDPIYAGRRRQPANISSQLATALQKFQRQALHACRLTLTHPGSGKSMTWQAPLPEDFTALLNTLQQDMEN
ncbi:MAG: 23S rRNA pseudouridine(1911/1915/1917) synthase RluD [Pseudohongiellaceae bacterium]